jgi:hypothetical protein
MKTVSPVVPALQEIEGFRGGPRAGQPEFYELPVLVTEQGNGHTCCFELEPHELEWLANGSKLYITVMLPFQPPIKVEVLNTSQMSQEQAMQHFNV